MSTPPLGQLTALSEGDGEVAAPAEAAASAQSPETLKNVSDGVDDDAAAKASVGVGHAQQQSTAATAAQQRQPLLRETELVRLALGDNDADAFEMASEVYTVHLADAEETKRTKQERLVGLLIAPGGISDALHEALTGVSAPAPEVAQQVQRLRGRLGEVEAALVMRAITKQPLPSDNFACDTMRRIAYAHLDAEA